jgi:hypothetical protein
MLVYIPLGICPMNDSNEGMPSALRWAPPASTGSFQPGGAVLIFSAFLLLASEGERRGPRHFHR